MRMRSFVLAAVAGASLAALAGCGEDGPKRYRVSGEVKFDGKPIPAGDVLLTPDGAKKNSGPQGIAIIRDGNFDTAAADGKGYGGGPTIVRVVGQTADGKVICEYEYQADLPPSQDATLNVEVPKTAAFKAGNRPEI